MSVVEWQKKLPRQIEQEFGALEKQARADLRSEGFLPEKTKLVRTMAMRYRGQSFELEISAESDPISRFHQSHRERYGHADEKKDVEIVSVRLRAIGLTDKPQLQRQKAVRKFAAKPQREALVWLNEKRRKVAVYDRAELQPGATINSPAIIVEYGSTTLIPTGWKARVDAWQNLLLDSTARLA